MEENFLRESRFIMVFWQNHIFLVLLLAFSGLNLIRSDCGADVDRLNGGSAGAFCDARYSRHNERNILDKNQQRQFRDFERRGDDNIYK